MIIIIIIGMITTPISHRVVREETLKQHFENRKIIEITISLVAKNCPVGWNGLKLYINTCVCVCVNFDPQILVP